MEGLFAQLLVSCPSREPDIAVVAFGAATVVDLSGLETRSKYVDNHISADDKGTMECGSTYMFIALLKELLHGWSDKLSLTVVEVAMDESQLY